MKIYLANPRGFCAGVDRAIDIVELSLKAYGAPIYVRHEIVHSRHVVNALKLKGAVFVEELSEVPDVQNLQVEEPDQLSYVTQTTLSVDECRDIVAALHKRFPKIKGPHQEDICYATQNRQNAVKKLTEVVDVILVIGSPNSSNSNRLRELGEHCGVPSYLIDSSDDINLALLRGIKAVGISAGASAPEVLVTEVLEYLKAHGGEVVEEMTVVEEDVEFLLPKELISAAEITRS